MPMDCNGYQERNVEQQNPELYFGRKRQDQSAMLAEVMGVGDGQCGPTIFQLFSDPEMVALGPGVRKSRLLEMPLTHTHAHTQAPHAVSHESSCALESAGWHDHSPSWASSKAWVP